MINKQHLITAEQFYSIQGEGPYCGHLAVFLRLAGCNLRCQGFSYQDPSTGEHLGCDSKLVWQHGQAQTFAAIIAYWQQQAWLDALHAGAHLIITGGEPLIQQTALSSFIQQLDQHLGKPVFIEIETNATFLCNDFLKQRLNHINASPKLRFSLEPRKKAYKQAVLSQLRELPQACFKFVIHHEDDLEEINKDYVQALSINPQRIWLMAEGGTVEAIKAKSAWLVELAKRYHMNYSPRLQIDIWDEVTGV